MCLNMLDGGIVMNTSNITNYKPKDFAELLGVSVKTLKAKCDEYGVELRIADKWYPSSRRCHCCGRIRKDLKLSDRIYRCVCGYVEDRDFNASLNLRDTTSYEIA